MPETVPNNARTTTSWRLVWLFSIASWTVIWLLMCGQSLVYFRENHLPVPWIKFVSWFLETPGLWGPASPLCLWYIWKRPLTRADWKQKDAWRALRILSEFVEGFDTLADLPPAVRDRKSVV